MKVRRLELHDLLAVGGVVAIVIGLAHVYQPAAWIGGGCIAIALSLWIEWQRHKR